MPRKSQPRGIPVNWWETLLAGFGYFFGAGFTAAFTREGINKKFDTESIFMGLFWPAILAVAAIWGIIMIPIWLGIKAYMLVEPREERELRKEHALKNLENDIKRLEKETGIQ